MRHQSGLRFVAAFLTWLPVGLLLSAATCETPQEKSDREFRQQMAAQQQLQLQMQWNALQQQKLAEEAKKQQLPPPGANPPDDQSTRGPQDRTIEIPRAVRL